MKKNTSKRQSKARPAQPARRPTKPIAIGLGILAVGALLLITVQKARTGNPSRTRNQPAATNQQFALRSSDGSLPTNAQASTSPASRSNGADPETTAAELNSRGNTLLKTGDFEGAVQAYRQALTLTPKDEDLHFNLGLAYARRGDLTNAEIEYREALRLLPDFPEVHNNLGKLLLRAGRLPEAEQELAEAINLMPEYAQAHNNLGILLQRQNRSAEALASFQKAIQCDTNYLEAHFNLAGAYVQQHDLEKAMVELRETLRINPDFKTAQQLLDQMTKAHQPTVR